MSVEQATRTAPAPHRPRTNAVTATLNVGLVAVAVAITISVAASSTALAPAAPTWLLPIAIVALAVGIPHGAVDHLTLSSALTGRQFVRMGLVYLLIAALGTAAIVAAPVPAFVLVLALTVWHFGTGDVEATRALLGGPPEQGATRVVHALALGCAPVLLPLTSPASAATLALIEPRLGQLITPTTVVLVRVAVFILIGVAMTVLIARRERRATVELLALTALGCLASPLLAFAVYFGLWHALRHTARLAQHTYGSVSADTMGRTFRRGVPSLIGFVVVVGLLASQGAEFASMGTWMWLGLAVVWGLTIPHMAFVAAFDHRQRLSPAQSPTGEADDPGHR